MAGLQPKPPEGWDDTGGGTGGKPVVAEPGERAKPPIGTPAGQH